MKTAYIAHPLVGDGSFGERQENLLRAAQWVAWLTERYEIVPVCPWIVLARIWPETLRKLGLEIDKAAAAGADLFVAVGREWTSGMNSDLSGYTRDRVPGVPGVHTKAIIDRVGWAHPESRAMAESTRADFIARTDALFAQFGVALRPHVAASSVAQEDLT